MRKVIVLSLFLLMFSCTKNTTEEPVAAKFEVVVSTQEGGDVSTTGGTYEFGKEVTVTATPKDGFQFAGWEGIAVAQTNSNPLTIKVTENTNVKATFVRAKHALKINVVGKGKVSQKITNVSNKASGSVTETTDEYTEGSSVRLDAVAEDGWIFYSWSGAAISTNKQTDVTMNESKVVTATFEERIMPRHH